MGIRPQPRVGHLHPAPWRKPWHAIDFQAPHLARVQPLMSVEPVLDAVVDPAMKVPEHRVHMG
ncbi:hypothetical protein D3C75_1077720 [compost metagenome]